MNRTRAVEVSIQAVSPALMCMLAPQSEPSHGRGQFADDWYRIQCRPRARQTLGERSGHWKIREASTWAGITRPESPGAQQAVLPDPWLAFGVTAMASAGARAIVARSHEVIGLRAWP